MFATGGNTKGITNGERAADLDQPQLSVVAIFVTGPAPVRPAREKHREEEQGGAQTVWTAEQEAAYKKILNAVQDRFAEPVADRFAQGGDRLAHLPLTAA